jgi:hypothetical protein
VEILRNRLDENVQTNMFHDSAKMDKELQINRVILPEFTKRVGVINDAFRVENALNTVKSGEDMFEAFSNKLDDVVKKSSKAEAGAVIANIRRHFPVGSGSITATQVNDILDFAEYQVSEPQRRELMRWGKAPRLQEIAKRDRMSGRFYLAKDAVHDVADPMRKKWITTLFGAYAGDSQARDALLDIFRSNKRAMKYINEGLDLAEPGDFPDTVRAWRVHRLGQTYPLGRTANATLSRGMAHRIAQYMMEGLWVDQTGKPDPAMVTEFNVPRKDIGGIGAPGEYEILFHPQTTKIIRALGPLGVGRVAAKALKEISDGRPIGEAALEAAADLHPANMFIAPGVREMLGPAKKGQKLDPNQL